VAREWTAVCLLVLSGVLSPAAAQEDSPLDEAVFRTFEALNSGDVAGYRAQYAPGAHVILEADSTLELDVDEWMLRIGGVDWAPRNVSSQILGNTAIVVAEVDGTLKLTGGGDLKGPWRYAETRVRRRGEWKIQELELSPLGGGPTDSGLAEARPAVPRRPGRTPPRSVPPPAAAAARAHASSRQMANPPFAIQGPAVPAFPDVITRDDEGNATVRAVRVEGRFDIDGNLDEPVYSEIAPMSGFIQSLPEEGAPATELTEAWVLFDDDNVYVSARAHDDVPESEWIANEMRRDANQIGSNDNFGVVFDTYYDRRNGYFFYTNPVGGMSDSQLTNEGNPNFDWNPVYDVRTGRFDGGWTVEMKIPFKSLRYRPGTEQVWGIQLRRAVMRKNEWAHLTLVSRAAAGASGRFGMTRISRAATLVGVEAPSAGVNLDVKPYGIASLTTNRAATPAVDNEVDGDGGVDLKWGVTQNLAADFTYNTDFAQVEVDEQQVNLTRFNLFFPEKREFFLESRGLFMFPTNGAGSGSGGGGTLPTLFFSRRIGLQGGQPIPILGGGRLTGKIGPLDVGALDIETDKVSDVGAELTNFAVVRVRGDILSRSNIGALFTRRSRSLVASGSNETYGADASFSLFSDLYISGYYARTHTEGIGSRDQSYQARVSYNGDLEGFRASHVLVEDNFNPEVGFLRRTGYRETEVGLRGSPRPAMAAIRQVTLEGSADYFENARYGYVESREISATLGIEFENSDQLSFGYVDSYENLVEDETITGATIAAGRYPFDAANVSYQFGPQRFFSGTLSGHWGRFYDGHLTSVGVNRGRVEVLPQLSLEPSVSLNWVRLPGQSINTVLGVTRVNYTFSPRMFLSGLVQYNSSAESFSANLRLRWEYAPGSEIFLVYTEERDTYDFKRFPVLSNRGLVFKMTRLLRL